MSLTTEQVKKIATLSRLKMDDAEITKHCLQLNKIFDWIAQLNEVNTDNVAPLTSIEQSSLMLRTDKITEGPNQDQLMKTSPGSKHGYFIVPRVIE